MQILAALALKKGSTLSAKCATLSANCATLGAKCATLGAKCATLGATAALEIALPLARMLILSRALSLSELGFASALATAYALYDQITDLAIHRHVYAEKREHYVAALAGAHGLLALRGVLLALGALVLAPASAGLFGLAGNSGDFAALAGPLLIRGFEHLEPKVAERDYRFGPQLRAALAGNALSLLALALALVHGPGHGALTASLYGLALGQTVASHLVATSPYRLSLFTPAFFRAARFGAPLMANGLGLAISAQGDRLLVGALLGVDALGLYAVAMLAVLVPVSLVQRMMGALSAAALFNAGAERPEKVRLIARLAPAVGAVYGAGALMLVNLVTPALFGARFILSPSALALLAIAAMLRIARTEPSTALLLLDQRTRRIAAGNLAALAALLFAAGLMVWRPSVEAAVAGRALGEAVALGVTFLLSRRLLGAAARDFLVSLALACALVAALLALRLSAAA